MWDNIKSAVLKAHPVAKALEPWGILLAVGGFIFTIWTFQVERADREDAHSGASGRLFQRHPVSHSEVSGHPEMTPLSVVT